jgi:hypothetical protein
MPCDRVWLAVISASRHKHQALNLAASLEENLVEDPSDRRRPLRLVDRLATSDDALGDPESHSSDVAGLGLRGDCRVNRRRTGRIVNRR